MKDGVKIAVIFVVVLFALGGIFYGYRAVFGPANRDLDRQIFENSRTHLEAVANDLADKCLQLAQSTDDTEKKALRVYILNIVNGEDMTKVQLAPWVQTCVDDAVATVGAK